MHQVGGTIKQALDRIVANDYVLPAIQREFVWRPEQICRLFDSLMQGYPFGDFLFWKIEPINSKNYRYYGFVLDYHQRDNPHCPDLGPITDKAITAVLDGQQRLTAFNIGLRGSMALKLPYYQERFDYAFPEKVLALNLLAETESDEEGNVYTFAFVKEEQIGKLEDVLWFKVGDILTMSEGPEMLN